jgi:ankyrin repeat protein
MELIDATKKNNINKIKKLLNREDIDINLQDRYGWTALMFANNGRIDIARLLCNFDRRSKFTEQSGFHPDCSLFEKEDIDINLQNKYGKTALMYASSYGNINMVKLLCNFDRRSKFTEQSGFQPDCSLLEKEDIHINLRDNDGQTALIIALRHNKIGIVNLLNGYDLLLSLTILM